MTTRLKILLAILALVTSYAFGYWTAPEKVKIEKQVVESTKNTENSNTDINRDKHKETTTTETIRPDGTRETTTKTVEDTKTDKKKNESDTSESTRAETDTKETEKSSSKTSILFMAGASLSAAPVNYGLAVSRPTLGPITVGVFGLQSGIIGGMLGLTF